MELSAQQAMSRNSLSSQPNGFMVPSMFLPNPHPYSDFC